MSVCVVSSSVPINTGSTMTVVKDDEIASSGEVAGAINLAEVDDNDLVLMTDSKLPDDWSIIGSKGLDNEVSDGESVEVIPCEEEKSEDSASMESLSPIDVSSRNELAIETRENIMQTEEVALLRSLPVRHHLLVFCIVCNVLLGFLLLLARNKAAEFPDLRKEAPNIRPALVELVEDWEQMSSKSPQDKALIINFLIKHFPLDEFDEEIFALLEKDMLQDSTVSPFHKKRRYSPNPPPPAQHKTTKPVTPPPVRTPVDEPQRKYTPPSNKNPDDEKFDCSNCKKYSSECKKFCKHNKVKGSKQNFFEKILSPITKRFPNFKNKF